MVQSSWTPPVDPAVDDGITLAQKLNDMMPALASTFSGPAAPPNPEKGQLWLDTSPETTHGAYELKVWTGSFWAWMFTYAFNTGQVWLNIGNPPTQGLLPAGTRSLFQQATAPTGWTKDGGYDNRALRVSAGGVSSGGAIGFTGVFRQHAMSGWVQDTTLAEWQMPSHQHNIPGGSIAFANAGNLFIYPKGDDPSVGNFIGYGTLQSDWRGGSGPHGHGFVGSTVDLNVAYVDVIIAQRDP